MKPRVFATQTAVNQGKIQPVKYYFVIFLFKWYLRQGLVWEEFDPWSMDGYILLQGLN